MYIFVFRNSDIYFAEQMRPSFNIVFPFHPDLDRYSGAKYKINMLIYYTFFEKH